MTIVDNSNNINDITIIHNFKLPRLSVKSSSIIDRKMYRNKLKLSMNIMPVLNINKINNNKSHNIYHNTYEYTDSSETIIDGVNIQRLHNNIRILNVSTMMPFINIPNILFLDYHHHEYTFWKDILYYIHNTVNISSIFVNEYETNTIDYYRSENIFSGIIRDHIFIQSVIGELLSNQTNNSLNEKYYVVIDQITNSIQQFDEIRELINNGYQYRVGQLHRITHGTKIRSEFRSKFDFVILNPFHIGINNLRRIYQQYFNIFPTFAIFKALVEELQKNKEFIIINTRQHSHNIYDRIYKIPLNTYPSMSVSY